MLLNRIFIEEELVPSASQLQVYVQYLLDSEIEVNSLELLNNSLVNIYESKKRKNLYVKDEESLQAVVDQYERICVKWNLTAEFVNLIITLTNLVDLDISKLD